MVLQLPGYIDPFPHLWQLLLVLRPNLDPENLRFGKTCLGSGGPPVPRRALRRPGPPKADLGGFGLAGVVFSAAWGEVGLNIGTPSRVAVRERPTGSHLHLDLNLEQFQDTGGFGRP